MAEVRRLLVDARPVNHPTARNRGIGRYTLGLLDGLTQINAPVVALFETPDEAALLAAAVPGLELRRLIPATVREFATEGTWYVATQLMLHPIPLDPVPSIITESGLPVAAVMYDVIPERYPEIYQQNRPARTQVQLRGALARTLDALLAISEFAADTAAVELRFPRQRIATIGAGADNYFQPMTHSVDETWRRVANMLVRDDRRLVVMVAGTDARKNTERMLRAWGSVPSTLRATHCLVVVAAVGNELQSQWHRWADEAGVRHDVVFTGGVTDDEMVALHQLAVLAVMPSTEEGFGLPVLEAAACGCPTITSNLSSLPEVQAFPAAEFDPFDVESIASVVERALTDEAFRAELHAAGARAVDRWTWANTARAVVESLTEFGPRQVRQLRPPPWRIAVQGRFDASGVGRANNAFADTVRSLPNAPEVHLLVDNGGTSTPTFAGVQRFPSRALGRFIHPSLFDRIIELTDVSDHDSLLASLAAR